jgi:hypothetical protein
MMYNTDFKVKYHDIKEELTWKLKNKTTEELEANPDPEYEYNNQDILDICTKLYRDELSSVFYAENVFDDKVDIGINFVLVQLKLNPDINLIIDELKTILLNNSTNVFSEQEKEYFAVHSDQLIMLTLFGADTFYMFHNCICQQLTLGTIDANLLDELKKNTIDVIKS